LRKKRKKKSKVKFLRFNHCSIASSVYTAFNIPKIATGIFVTALVMVIVAGGVSRINSVTEKIVPFMALFYIIGSAIIIAMNADMIIPAFKMIFVGAFNPQAIDCTPCNVFAGI